MASDENNHNCENAFPKSSIGTLITQISKMLRNPVVETDLNETLDSFLDELNETQQYLSHGIFNVKFAEAGLFLQNAVALYGKKVDLLWDSTLQYQMQLCSYNKSSEENSEEASKITQRLNRNKRKKLVLQDVDSSRSLYEDLSAVCDKANEFLKGRCASVQRHVDANLLPSDDSSDSALNVQVSNERHKSICGFKFPVDCPVNNVQTGEKLCNYNDLYLNCSVPFLETSEQSRVPAQNVDSSECSMNNPKNDWLLQKYVTERHLTYKKFWAQLHGNDFEIFRQAHQHEACTVETNIRLSLDERARSLCPKEFVVKVTRLPSELMSEYVKSNNVQVQELVQDLLTREEHAEITVPPVANTIKKGSERISNADSMFHDGPFDDSEVAQTSPETCDTILLTQRSCADSGYGGSEGLALSGVTESCEDVNVQEDLVNTNSNDAEVEPLQIVEEHTVNGQVGADSFVTPSLEQIVENIGRNEYVVDSLDRLENEDENIVTGIKNLSREEIPAIPTQITVVHKTNLKPMKDIRIEKQNLKRKIQKEQNSAEQPEKRRRFRWLKTTTSTLRTFERFFKENYQPEFGEGDIAEYESDDESVAQSTITGLENFEVENEEVVATDLDEEARAETLLDHSVGQPVQESGSSVLTVEADDFTPSCENDAEVFDSVPAQTTSPEVNGSHVQERVDPVDNVGDSLSTSSFVKSANSTEVNASNIVVATRGNAERESIERLRAVTEWKKFIEPKLKAAEHSSKFDIHDYGTRIMNAIPTEKNLDFVDLAQGKPPSEVARLFLASLQLANTYNVELVAPQQGELANDKLQIKLLTKERYHEHLDEYEAPSENSFREKLARVQALQPSVPIHSTPSKSRNSVKYKRQKFC